MTSAMREFTLRASSNSCRYMMRRCNHHVKHVISKPAPATPSTLCSAAPAAKHARPLAINMMVAYLTADAKAVQMLFVDPSLFLSAEPFMYLLTSLLVVAFGPGALSVDALIRSRVAESRKDEDEMSDALAA